MLISGWKLKEKQTGTYRLVPEWKQASVINEIRIHEKERIDKEKQREKESER